MSQAVTTDDHVSLSSTERLELQRSIEARAAFQESWLEKFEWLVYDVDQAKMFCKFCLKYPHHHSAYSKKGSINFKFSNLKAHCRTECHVNAMDAFLLEGKETIQNSMKKVENFKDEALLTLFKVAYHMAKKNYAFYGFADMIGLLQDCRVPFSTSLYNDDKDCAEMFFCIGKSLMDTTLKKVSRSLFFGVLVDESNDICKHGHLIIYLSYLIDECIPAYSFYGIVQITHGTTKSIFNVIHVELKKSKFDVSKLVAFGSDGCSTMTGKENGVATLIKKYVNPFLTSIHCVAHRAALAVSSVAKNLEYAKTLETLVNSIAIYFNASNKRMEDLQATQENLACPILKLEHTFEVRWLTRASAISKVCTSLDAILVETKENAQSIFADLKYGPDKGHLFTLRGALRGNKYFDIEIERDLFGNDLANALEFQVSFAKGIVANLESRFADNSVLSKLRVLVPSQHPVLEKTMSPYLIEHSQNFAVLSVLMKLHFPAAHHLLTLDRVAVMASAQPGFSKFTVEALDENMIFLLSQIELLHKCYNDAMLDICKLKAKLSMESQKSEAVEAFAHSIEQEFYPPESALHSLACNFEFFSSPVVLSAVSGLGFSQGKQQNQLHSGHSLTTGSWDLGSCILQTLNSVWAELGLLGFRFKSGQMVKNGAAP
ncbi:hypothetical protein L7F22_061718 [Adiantum nelumboides]|nr:hypothetical protein [Adiantum nelumboides]